MAKWLVVVLKGAFASFSDSPGNSLRKVADMPTRSALIGLAGAALGIRREDDEGQSALSAVLVTASAQLNAGWTLADFHTFQSLNQAAKGARTRAGALANKQHLETAITRREYRTDAIWQAAFRLSATPGEMTLEALVEAFRQPHFVLYIGRRSCPPSHPLNPRVYNVDDVRDAFVAHAADTKELNARTGGVISLEDAGDVQGANLVSEHRRRDDPLDRTIRWTFAERAEWRLTGPDAGRKEPLS